MDGSQMFLLNVANAALGVGVTVLVAGVVIAIAAEFAARPKRKFGHDAELHHR